MVSERERANAWQETLCFLWAWWVWCVLLYSASKASETLLLSCQVNNTNNFPSFVFHFKFQRHLQKAEPLQVFTAWSLKANGMKWRRNTEWNSQSWNQSFPCLHRSQAAESADRRGRYGQICACLSVIPWHNSLTSNRGMFSENRDDEKKKMGKEHRRCQDGTVKTA